MGSCEEDAIEGNFGMCSCGTVVPSCQYRASPLSRVFQMDTTPASFPLVNINLSPHCTHRPHCSVLFRFLSSVWKATFAACSFFSSATRSLST